MFRKRGSGTSLCNAVQEEVGPGRRASAQWRAGAGGENMEGSARRASAQHRGAGQNEKPGGVRLRSAGLRAGATCVRACVRPGLVRLWFGRPRRGIVAEGAEVPGLWAERRGSGRGLGYAVGGEGATGSPVRATEGGTGGRGPATPAARAAFRQEHT